jgi:urease accessory protein
LVRNQHTGPLRVQKLLYPERAAVAHTLLLHPPGGLAGGDELVIDLMLAPGSEVLATTPGATKWYHGERGTACQSTTLKIAADACLEWMPQESILFDGADARQSLVVELHRDARMFGWDIVQLGSVAATLPWQQGRWRQRVQLIRDSQERWREQVDMAANDPLRNSPLGLAGHSVLATAWAAAPNLRDGGEELIDMLRECAAQFPLPCGISWLPAPTELLMIRVLGHDCALVRELLESLWTRLRPRVSGHIAVKPRIWST